METAVEVNVAHPEIDTLINSVDKKKNEWARLAISEKIKLLLEVKKNTGIYASEWVDLSVKGKQIEQGSPLAGEEWTSGPWVFASTINNYIETLEAIDERNKSKLLNKVTTRNNGQVVVNVFPNNIYEKLLFNGISAEVWMQEGVTSDNLVDSIGVFYDQENPQGKLSLVLGAGNISGIPPLDILQKLIGEKILCLNKKRKIYY